MRVVALDLSKSNAGFAVWSPGDDQPEFGSWELGIPGTPDGRVFARLHQKLSALDAERELYQVFYEAPLDARKLSGSTNIDSLRVLAGLAAHAESWAYVKKCALVRVNMSTWRRHFIGPQPRGTKRASFKRLVKDKAAHYGWKVRSDDESDALGLLDYACDYYLALDVPWRAHEKLALVGGT